MLQKQWFPRQDTLYTENITFRYLFMKSGSNNIFF